jgi:hypothetical protein
MKNINEKKGCWMARLSSAAVMGAILLAGPVQAATQGSIGATSTGTVAITASVPNRALITSLTDVTFANADPSVAASNSQAPCVWSNTSTRNYKVTATGTGTAGAFTLASGASVIPYSVGWANAAGSSSPTALVAGTASASLASNATNITCSGSGNSTLQVTIGASDLQNMVATDSYTGTLTLVVQPQ